MDDADAANRISQILLTQAPVFFISLIGLVVTLGFWRRARTASRWAIGAFALGIVICILNILDYVATSFLTGLMSVPLLKGVTYLLLLIAVYAGRTSATEVGREESLWQPVIGTFRERPGLKSVFFAIFWCFFLLIVLSGIALTYLLPESYVSTARIRVERDHADIQPMAGNQQTSLSYDPYFIQTEFEVLKSELILGKVIKHLGLKEKWTKKFNMPLSTQQTLELLQKAMDLRLVRNTSIIEIRYYSGDKREAAEVANAIAETYRDHRRDQSIRLSATGIEALTNRLAQVEEEIHQLQIKAKNLRVQFNIPETLGRENPSAMPTDQAAPYWEAKRMLEGRLRFLELLSMKIATERTDLDLPKTSMVEIVDRAAEGLWPVRPNKEANITVAIVVGFLLAFVVAGAITAVAWASGRKLQKGAAPPIPASA